MFPFMEQTFPVPRSEFCIGLNVTCAFPEHSPVNTDLCTLNVDIHDPSLHKITVLPVPQGINSIIYMLHEEAVKGHLYICVGHIFNSGRIVPVPQIH